MKEHPIFQAWYKAVGIVAIVIAFGAGIYLGYDSGSHQAGAAPRADLTTFWKVWDLLEENYVATSTSTPVSDEDKLNAAIAGLVESYGDPYTVYFPPAELKSFEEDIKGNFEGVGMEVGIRNDVLTVVAPLKNTPAEKAGLKAGDVIKSIDGHDASGLSVDEAVKLIRGKAGSVVSIVVMRPGESKERTFPVTRAVIKIPTLETEFRKADNVFVISLFNFSAGASTEFRNALREFAATKSDRLIIDLRNNPGGYLDAAVDISSWFLPAGKVVVKEDFGTKEETQILRSKGYNAFTDKLKIVVLVNGGSASASEIVAGALHDHGRAKLVGEKTFGKGSVQELIPVTKDTSLKVTVARWLTPNGTSISATGIVPDVEVEMTDEDIKAERDPQLLKAIEVLKAMK
jgi:carboxyl-terminal processing protease